MNDMLALDAAHAHLMRSYGFTRPEGSWVSGKWYPSDQENADNYTKGIVKPTLSFPLSYFKAAKSLRHVCALLEADEKVARKYVSILKKETWMSERELACAVDRVRKTLTIGEPS